MFGVSPTASRSDRPLPPMSPMTTSPVWIPIRTAIGGRPSASRRRFSVAIAETIGESRLDGATRVRLIGDGVAVVGQDAVAEVLGDVALACLDLAWRRPPGRPERHLAGPPDRGVATAPSSRRYRRTGPSPGVAQPLEARPHVAGCPDPTLVAWSIRQRRSTIRAATSCPGSSSAPHSRNSARHAALSRVETTRARRVRPIGCAYVSLDPRRGRVPTRPPASRPRRSPGSSAFP